MSSEIAIAVEPFARCYGDLRALHTMHWQSLDAGQRDELFMPAYSTVAEWERRGEACTVVARDDAGTPIGVLTVLINQAVHNPGVTEAHEVSFFVSKQQRSLVVANSMIKAMEATLRKAGVNYLFLTSRGVAGGPELRPLLMRARFAPHATIYRKRL